MSKFDIHQHVTDSILSALEKGVGPWKKPWKGTGINNALMPHNGVTGHVYRGINPWMMASAAFEFGWDDPRWATSKQYRKRGWKLREGQRFGEGGPGSSLVVFWKPINITDKDDKGKEVRKTIPLMRFYKVFNFQQLEGPEQLETREPTEEEKVITMATAQGILDAVPSTVNHGGNRASYSPMQDSIRMPNFEDFRAEGDYWVTNFHEHGHWTGHKSRLDRDFSGRFGDEAYAFEELVAELAAANLAGHAGIHQGEDIRPDHAQYIAAWIKTLQDDKRAITHAAAKADQATKLILSYSAEGGEE